MNNQNSQTKIRLDELLLSKNLVPTRSQARQLIKDGAVLVDQKPATKPGQLTLPTAQIEITRDQYVSRAAHKLSPAFTTFQIDPAHLTIGDIGASTGGFTELLLQHNAKKIYAIDVGHDQLAPKLRQDPRVINLEKTNIRHLDPKTIEPLDLCVVDLSFISLHLALPNISSLLKPSGQIIALFKPQFEVGPTKISPKGIASKKDSIQALQNLRTWCLQNKLKIAKTILSPIKGKTGNQEYLLLIKKN